MTRGQNEKNLEIERKFLVGAPLPDMDAYDKAEILQGYISNSPVIRLRREDDAYTLTIKGPGYVAREEYELRITEAQFNELWKKTEGGSVTKTRCAIPLPGGLAAQLDTYHGALQGLMTVEVEFSSLEAAAAFAPPVWFGRDVSGDGRYGNGSLARYGIPREG